MAEGYVSPDEIRTAFSAAMSAMYRDEVPAYGALMDLVSKVNSQTLAGDGELRERLDATASLDRISQERHGAIRLGTGVELAMMRRIFAVMGMLPVGYYDLTAAGVPVHATAFRPLQDLSLKRNPFRVFASVLRLDLIADAHLRAEAKAVLEKRQIFTDGAIKLTLQAERNGGLERQDADRFVAEALETFRWHDRAAVSADLYRRLHAAHRLVADVVSFKGPHINHLTPRTLDIDVVQARMPAWRIIPKAVIEGPPSRACPILLRQTSFKALEESVSFQAGDGTWQPGSHTARFGEIEQRGAALTPKGRALYDRLLIKARSAVNPAADGSNAQAYKRALSEAFAEFPDNWKEMRQDALAYFSYSLTAEGQQNRNHIRDIEQGITDGLVRFDPIVYEDFLPVSAAGIFQSNLGGQSQQQFASSPNKMRFEAELGSVVVDEFAHYASVERASLDSCLKLHRLPEGSL
ncbi:MAG: VOC family protein [Pseudomonadota bacterium]